MACGPRATIVTDDGLVIMASEVGVLPHIPEEKIVSKWRLQPGKMLLVDLEEHRIISDEELKSGLAEAYPYQIGSTRRSSVYPVCPLKSVR